MLKTLTKNNSQVKYNQDSLKKITDQLDSLKTPFVSSQICSICTFNFNLEDRIPICLPCGHTICKHCVYSLKSSSLFGVCPYDRKEYSFIPKLLPTNYALLNTEDLEMSQTCKIHGLELVAFCKDHEFLLCGKCFFLHASHNFLEIGSEKTSLIADEKLKNLRLSEERISQAILIWEDYIGFLKRVLASIEGRSEMKKVSKMISKSLSAERKHDLVNFIEEAKCVLKRVGEAREIYKNINIYQQLSINFAVPELIHPSLIDINF